MTDQKQLRTRIRRITLGLLVAAVFAALYGLYICIESVEGIIHSAGMGRNVVAPHIAELAEGLVLLVHYFLVAKFFIVEIRKKVPLNHEGAHELRIIGWETVILPIVVKIITFFAYVPHQIPTEYLSIEIYELVLGVILIQTGYVIDYATAKIESGHRYHLIYRYLSGSEPELMENAKAWADAQIIDEHEMMADE